MGGRKAGPDFFHSSDEGSVASRPVQAVGLHLGSGGAPGQDRRRGSRSIMGARSDRSALRREAAGARGAARGIVSGAIRGVSGDGGGRASAVRDRGHTMVVRLVGHHLQEAGSMGRGSVGASKEGGDLRGGSEALGGSLGEAINEPVGPPINGGEELAIAQLRHADSFFSTCAQASTRAFQS